jgi:hypothetical protein
MKASEFVTEAKATKTRLDPKCWSGKKIGTPKTKIKGGVRVNNCVPNESVELDEISRRDFLKGAGATAGLAAMGATSAKSPSKGTLWFGDREEKIIRNFMIVYYFLKESPDNFFQKWNPDMLSTMQSSVNVFKYKLSNGGVMLQEVYNSVKNQFDSLKQTNYKMWYNEWFPWAINNAKKIISEFDSLVEFAQNQEKSDTKVAEELAEEFDLIESTIDQLALRNGVDAEAIWEDLESLTDDELYVFAVTQPIMEDWQKANKKDRTAGMSQKAVNAYRRENPGSKLKTAVTTKPSKLKKGSKASKRRKSYCSRSRGQMKMHSISCAKTPDKAICKARRRWNCE